MTTRLAHWHWVVFGACAFLIFKSFLVFDVQSFDFAYYHLPFGLRIFNSTTLVFSEWMDTLYKGYPPLAHALQGFLAVFLGRMSFSSGVNGIAFLLLAAVLFLGEKSSRVLALFLLALLSVPLLVLHSYSGLIDFWIGTFLFLSLYSLMRWEESKSIAWVKRMGFFLAVACYSKYQAWPVAAVILVVATIQAVRLKHRGAVFWIVLSGLLCAGWPLRNYLLFENPTYPYPMPTLSSSAPKNAWTDLEYLRQESIPAWAKDKSRAELFAVSFLELNRFREGVPYQWTVDGGLPEKDVNPHYRLGGYSIYSVLILLFAFGWGVKRKLFPTYTLACFFLSCLFISQLTQSHELRYWLFVPLFLCFGFARFISSTETSPRAAIGLTALMFFSTVNTLIHVQAWQMDLGGVSSIAPKEARDFWNGAVRGSFKSPYLMNPAGRHLIFWTGPDFKSVFVRMEENI